MPLLTSVDRLRFIIGRFREQLWVKPLVVCLLSVAGALAAKFADSTGLTQLVPEVSLRSIETLLSIMASSMLVIATFSVGSMVAAFSSASSTATPRSFALVISDNTSQNALSTFVGSFIFSIVALTAVKNSYFESAGLFILFVQTAIVFSIVIVTFVRWVDCIARLGRMGTTIDMVEQATARAIKRRQAAPSLGGTTAHTEGHQQAVFTDKIGYVQHINIAAIQSWATTTETRIIVAALPGTLATPDRALAYVCNQKNSEQPVDYEPLINAFQIGYDRLFEDDPRFGLVVLSEIAGRALSPAVNDPGTAIDIIGTLLRLLNLWNAQSTTADKEAPDYDRVEVPEIYVEDMFDDAFTAIARDGASTVEVSVRLQKALLSLSSTGDTAMQNAAKHHAKMALERAKTALSLKEDYDAVAAIAKLTIDSNNTSLSPSTPPT